MTPLRRTLSLAALMLGLVSEMSNGQSITPAPLPRLHANGQRFVDPTGKPVLLHGVNLGNWLLVEPGVFGGAIGDFPDQYTLFKVLRDRFGPEEGDRLISLYRDHFMTERDVAAAKSFGVNLLRVGFDYSVFEDDAKPIQLRPDAFKYTDRALAWAKQHGMYVLFDLHGAPEQQVDGKQSGRVGHNRFWKDPAAQERSLWLWQQIVERYRGETNILGYEALNEPWGHSPSTLRDYCERWYKAVRPIDDQAVLVMPCWVEMTGADSVGFFGTPTERGWSNVAFDVHFYPGLFARRPPYRDAHPAFLSRNVPMWQTFMNKANAPLIIGEIKIIFPGDDVAEMTRRYQDTFDALGWPMITWTWKELTATARSPVNGWMLATNAQPLPKVNIRTSSSEEIAAFFTSFSTMPLQFDEPMRHWLTTKDTPPKLPPSTAPALGPARQLKDAPH